MACFYCQVCDRMIDLDWDVEHYERCPTLDEEDTELKALPVEVVLDNSE